MQGGIKIIFNNDKNTVSLDKITMGQTFVYKGEVYMKMGEYSNLNYNALLLSHGFLEKLPNNCNVEVVNCELIISRCERSRHDRN